MGLKFNKPKATAQVSTVQKVEGKEVSNVSETEPVEVPETVAPSMTTDASCTVGFEAGYTHGLPNYSSTRIGVSVKIPCSMEELNDVADYAEDWVNQRMEKLVGELVG